VLRAPALVVCVWLLTIAASLPLTMAIGGSIARQLGSSLEADAVARGIDVDWMQEYRAQAGELGATLSPVVVGVGATFDSFSALLDSIRRPRAIAVAAAIYAALWLFMEGGLIDRYRRETRSSVSDFFRVSRVFFWRFLRLSVLMVIAWAAVFRWLHPWLFADVYPRLIDGLTVERTAFAIRAALYVVFVLVLAALNLLFEYAKIRAVVEDRRSMIGALAAGWRFIRRHARAVALLYAADAVLFLLVIGAYWLAAPNTGGTGAFIWIGLAIGQIYILARLAVRLVFWASETVLFDEFSRSAGL
jgi:hypothetical protein